MGSSKLEKRLRQENLSSAPPVRRGAFQILKSIHRDIKGYCGASDRRCWEYMLEILADWTRLVPAKLESEEAEQIWKKVALSGQWLEFVECWIEEVTYAKENGCAFSEPLGELLEDLQGTNTNLDQYFTPMALVRLMNQMSLPEGEGPPLRAMEPCCGTGRIVIDALVHNDRVTMRAIDLDIWMVRTAMLNARILIRWTAGRCLFMRGNSMLADVNYQPNWVGGWNPPPWQSTLKIRGYLGSYNEWEAAGKPTLEESGKPGEVQFDYSMKEKQWEKHLLEETG